MDYVQLYRLLPKAHSTWTIADTSIWLQFIGLSHLAPEFQKCSIDGSILSGLSEQDFKDQLHIESRVILKKLINWVTVGIKQFDNYVSSITGKNLSGSRQGHKTMQNICFQNQSQFMLTGSQLGKGKIKNNSALQPLRREATHAERQKQPEKNVLIIRQCETSLGMNNYSFSEKGGFIGRQSNNDIIVNDNYVSRRHAEIVYKDENYFIRDLASSTGTFIKVTEKQPVLNGMILEMGSYQFLLEVEENTLIIRVIDGPLPEHQDELVYPFTDVEKISLGRKDSNEINFPEDQHLSGLHSKLFKVGGVWYVQDMATTNGTWIRLSRQAEESDLYPLQDQTVFKLSSNLIYECQRNKGSRKTYKQKQQKCIFCLKQERNAIFMPCKHNIACVDCAAAQNIDRCNCCESAVQQVIKIFTA